MLTFLNPQQVKFSFKLLSKGTIAEGASLSIASVPIKIHCKGCGFEGEATYEGPEHHDDMPLIQMRCPRCGAVNVDIVEGRSCNIKDVKIIQ